MARSSPVVVWWMVRRAVLAFAVALVLLAVAAWALDWGGRDFGDVGGPGGALTGLVLLGLVALPMVVVLGLALGGLEWLALRLWPGSALPAVVAAGLGAALVVVLVLEWWEPHRTVNPLGALVVGGAVAAVVGVATRRDVRRLTARRPAAVPG